MMTLESDYFWIQCFLLHLIRWPTSRDTAFKKMRDENQAGPLFTIVNSRIILFSPLFIQMTVYLDAGIQMRCGQIHCIQN